jgi:hypothetical protein
VLPPPPQADEKIAAVIATTPNQRAEFARLMKVEIGDITDDVRDTSFVIARALGLLASISPRMLA